jgi:hypothetical protein
MSHPTHKNPAQGHPRAKHRSFHTIDQRQGTLYRSSMEMMAQPTLFAEPEPSPWMERAKYVGDSFGLMLEAQKKHGGIVEARSAAKMAKISKSRLFQLLENESIQRVVVRDADGQILIEGFSARSILDWAKSVKSGGRKFAEPLSGK